MEGEFVFILIRKQFPIKLSFAMTINKSQSQTLHVVGLDLRNPAFTHGQLYVTMSSVTNVNNLAVLYKGIPSLSCTYNIVYSEVLLS